MCILDEFYPMSPVYKNPDGACRLYWLYSFSDSTAGLSREPEEPSTRIPQTDTNQAARTGCLFVGCVWPMLFVENEETLQRESLALTKLFLDQ